MYNKTIIRVGFVISRTVKVSARVISRSRFWISQTLHPIIVNVARLDFQKKYWGQLAPTFSILSPEQVFWSPKIIFKN